jgi:hypothetical protein
MFFSRPACFKFVFPQFGATLDTTSFSKLFLLYGVLLAIFNPFAGPAAGAAARCVPERALFDRPPQSPPRRTTTTTVATPAAPPPPSPPPQVTAHHRSPPLTTAHHRSPPSPPQSPLTTAHPITVAVTMPRVKITARFEYMRPPPNRRQAVDERKASADNSDDVVFVKETNADDVVFVEERSAEDLVGAAFEAAAANGDMIDLRTYKERGAKGCSKCRGAGCLHCLNCKRGFRCRRCRWFGYHAIVIL